MALICVSMTMINDGVPTEKSTANRNVRTATAPLERSMRTVRERPIVNIFVVLPPSSKMTERERMFFWTGCCHHFTIRNTLAW